jgi:hypothetical protein
MRSIACCGFLLCAFVLQGCGGYWYAAPEMAGPVEQVIVTDNVLRDCGQSNSAGCWLPTTGTIFIKAGVSVDERACVERHERKHAAGFNHDDRTNFRLNCGED